MNLIVNNHNIFFIIAVTFVISFITTFITKKLSHHINAIDIPNKRSVHIKPIPRLGGLAIFTSFLFGYIFFGKLSLQIISILIGSFIIILTGIVDDIKSIKARYKFIMQIIASLVVVLYGGIYFTEIQFAGVYLFFGKIFGQILSVFFIVSITNAINLIDGLDGLASGISFIYFVTIGIIAFILNKVLELDIILTMIMIGSTLGFLFHNFPPASIFLGDTGSMFLGFMISVIALLGYKVATLTSLVIPIFILGIPISDTILAILRRLINKNGIGKADKEHLHHQLLKLKFSNKVSILVIYVINMLFSILSIFYALGDYSKTKILYLILSALLIFIIIKTDILYDRKKK